MFEPTLRLACWTFLFDLQKNGFQTVALGSAVHLAYKENPEPLEKGLSRIASSRWDLSLSDRAAGVSGDGVPFGRA